MAEEKDNQPLDRTETGQKAAAELRRKATEMQAKSDREEYERNKAEMARKAEAARAQRSAPSAAATPAAATPAAAVVKHTWTKDDTYASLAQKHYGSIKEPYWRLIYDHNKAIIGDHPNDIRVGLEIEIPPLPDELQQK